MNFRLTYSQGLNECHLAIYPSSVSQHILAYSTINFAQYLEYGIRSWNLKLRGLQSKVLASFSRYSDIQQDLVQFLFGTTLAILFDTYVRVSRFSAELSSAVSLCNIGRYIYSERNILKFIVRYLLHLQVWMFILFILDRCILLSRESCLIGW